MVWACLEVETNVEQQKGASIVDSWLQRQQAEKNTLLKEN